VYVQVRIAQEAAGYHGALSRATGSASFRNGGGRVSQLSSVTALVVGWCVHGLAADQLPAAKPQWAPG